MRRLLQANPLGDGHKAVHAEVGKFAGGVVGITILFVVVIALAGLGIVVVKALGGEESKFPKGAALTRPPVRATRSRRGAAHHVALPPRALSRERRHWTRS